MPASLPLLALLLLLGACAHYEPGPSAAQLMDSGRPAESIDRAVVDMDACAHLEPACTTGRPYDRLTLFAVGRVYNSDVRAAAARLEAVVANVDAVREWPPPSLSLAAEYAGNARESSPWMFAGAFDVPLDAGERRIVRIESADRDVLLARYDLVDRIWSLHSEVRRALTDLLVAERELGLRGHLARERATQVTVLEHRAEQGETSRSDMDRLRFDIAAETGLRREAEARREGALQRLAATLGLTRAALDGVALEWNDFERPDDDPGCPADDEGALHRQPALLRSIVAYDQADAMFRLEIAHQYPGVSVAPGYTWERSLVKLPLGLNLALPPFDLNRSAIRAARYGREAAAADLEAAYAQVGAQRETTCIALVAARDRLRDLRAGEIPAAERVAETAQAEFDAGAINRAELIAARVGVLMANLSGLAALKGVRDAESDYEDAIRRPIEGPETEFVQR